ncbi:MAG: beta-lactamase family protein [Planctomycetes bacterium]|nr:beta-lactamase family protein [Planctomycetota bacterium]
MNPQLPLVATFLLASFSCQPKQSNDARRPSDLHADAESRLNSIKSQFASTDLPFAVVGYITGQGEREFITLGEHTGENQNTPGDQCIFDIASMTKAITATAALQLVEQKKVSLDQPLEEIMPELLEVQILKKDGSRSPSNNPITLRDLLRHTSGFTYFFGSPEVMAEIELDTNGWPLPESIKEGVFDWEFGIQPRRVFESGTDWIYGRGVGVAGRVIERISGQTLDSYFKEHIFRPLGMERSGYNIDPSLHADRTRLYFRGPESETLIPVPDSRPVPMKKFYGGGSLLSTPSDYARFLSCLIRGGELDGERILSPESVALLMTDQLPEKIRVHLPPMNDVASSPRNARSFLSEYDDGYSLGWAIEVGAEDGLRPEGVGYWSGIHNTYYTIDQDHDIAIVLFTQTTPFDDPEAYELYRSYEDLIYESLLLPTE